MNLSNSQNKMKITYVEPNGRGKECKNPLGLIVKRFCMKKIESMQIQQSHEMLLINHAFSDGFTIVNFAFIPLPLLTQQTRLAFTMVK